MKKLFVVALFEKRLTNLLRDRDKTVVTSWGHPLVDEIKEQCGVVITTLHAPRDVQKACRVFHFFPTERDEILALADKEF